MTVSYNSAVSSVSSFSVFRLLLHWRGSIWKSILGELLLWTICYYIVFAVYRFALNAPAQRNFEEIVHICNERLAFIPLTFMLGFFVSMIINRWRDTFDNMGWIENLALTLTQLLEGDGKENRMMRRTIIRYTVLTQILVFRDISLRVRRRFPTMESLVEAGFMTKAELKELSKISLAYNRYWTPLYWALGISFKALEKNYFETPWARICVQNEIQTFRTNMALLCNFDWVPIPISYPQVVFLAVRSYFVICLVSRQFLICDKLEDYDEIQLYIPFMTMLEFTFLVGWMKVAEGLLNPLGEDDDDFECNFVIDKNIATGLCIVDDEYRACPELKPDCFTDPEYKPIYTEYSHVDGGKLAGSAEDHRFEAHNGKATSGSTRRRVASKSEEQRRDKI
ncbi:Bestrophin [Trichostrongylus colubriformis]|uniref:Bestrophin homolog n=1 Tax=Trichostrongylus colubriformis TaxID=6319 RepID=A0AAN8IP55_TRICO